MVEKEKSRIISMFLPAQLVNGGMVVPFILVGLEAAFPGGPDGKEFVFNAGDPGSFAGLGTFPGKGNGNSLQYSCLDISMDRGAWWAIVHSVAKSQTLLSDSFFLSFFGGKDTELMLNVLNMRDCLASRWGYPVD